MEMSLRLPRLSVQHTPSGRFSPFALIPFVLRGWLIVSMLFFRKLLLSESVCPLSRATAPVGQPEQSQPQLADHHHDKFIEMGAYKYLEGNLPWRPLCIAQRYVMLCMLCVNEC